MESRYENIDPSSLSQTWSMVDLSHYAVHVCVHVRALVGIRDCVCAQQVYDSGRQSGHHWIM